MSLNFITAKKFIQGSKESKDVFYMGNRQADGWTYFNDDTSYRTAKVKVNDENGNEIEVQRVELFYIPKQIWIQCGDFENLTVIDFDVIGILQDIFGILAGGGGGGGVAPIESVEKAVQWQINKVRDNFITYSQTNRNLKNVNGKSYDCSSFVITSYTAAGVDINATYTGDMIAGFTAAGWEWIPGRRWESNQLLRGDILLNISRHTQVYIGGGKDVNCGSTPARIVNHSVDYYGRGWDGILRYKGASGGGVTP